MGREGGDWGGWMVGAPFSSVRACPPTCNLQAPALKIFLTYDEHNKHCNTDVNFTTSPGLQNQGGVGVQHRGATLKLQLFTGEGGGR